MAQLNVSMPERLQQWVDARVALGRYASPGDYLRELVRRDKEARRVAALQALVDEGRASGVDPRPWREIVDKMWSNNPT